VGDVQPFGLLIVAAAAAALLAVLSNRLSERIHLPAPAMFFAAAAAVAHLAPTLHTVSPHTVDRIVTVALVVILFDGGLHIGWPKFRAAAGPIALVGVIGTFLTAGATALLAHALVPVGWWGALLIGTAVAPTDPAVVFSVLGKREVAGRSGTILEGESGANDPVGIALMASLLGAGGLAAGAVGQVAGAFVLEMVVGGVVGVVGGRLLLLFMQQVPLPGEGLYPLRTLAGVLLLYGTATVAGGSGFLAVFTAGVLLGRARAPYKRDIERFHSALASMGEIVAFVVLGLTVDLHQLARADVLLPGLLIGTILAFVIRPALVGLCLSRVDLGRNERAFVLWAGLKGAVPILLGTFLLTADVPQAPRLYAIIVVVVAFSVLVQATLVPTVAQRLHVPMRNIEPEPWSLGVRLRDEPRGVHRLTIADGSPADGCTIADLSDIGDDVWISFVVRSGILIPVRGSTRLQAGDDVLILGEPTHQGELAAAFTEPQATQPPVASTQELT
jgi:cell volume regulation protein A